MRRCNRSFNILRIFASIWKWVQQNTAPNTFAIVIGDENMPCLEGFKEKHGLDLLHEEFVKRKLFDTAVKHGYSYIVIPVIEKATSFSEEVVGRSPWPEWNEKGCFFFDLQNYRGTYDQGEKERVLLIPEGTISVTRWLGDQINSGNVDYPLKLFYSVKCYRNELLDSLSETKFREFEQFGTEILGSSNVQSDTEIIYMIYKFLEDLGVKKECIRIRLNDVAIFTTLIQECGISFEDQTILKELLDYLAEAKAGKHAETADVTRSEIRTVIGKYTLDDIMKKRWDMIIEGGYDQIDDFYRCFDEKYHHYYRQLIDIKSSFAKLGVKIKTDLCVIRSHEYYTGISFEVDVITKGQLYFEIAGGGRYNRLVQHFVLNKNVESIPCTGFAFGLERLITMLRDMGTFIGNKEITSTFHFSEDRSQLIIQ